MFGANADEATPSNNEYHQQKHKTFHEYRIMPAQISAFIFHISYRQPQMHSYQQKQAHRRKKQRILKLPISIKQHVSQSVHLLRNMQLKLMTSRNTNHKIF